MSANKACSSLPVLAVLLLAALGGCAQKGRMARDPFRPQPGSRAQSPQGPDSPGPWQDQNRDIARDRSTSPVTDPLSGSGRAPYAGSGPAPYRDDRSSADRGSDLRESDAKSQPAKKTQPAGPPDGAAPQDANKGVGGTVGGAAAGAKPSDAIVADYQSIRQRLDKAGARIDSLETDPASGQYVFRCMVPYAANPELVRVFAARDKDELKAMLAVTTEVEKWVANRGPSGQ